MATRFAIWRRRCARSAPGVGRATDIISSRIGKIMSVKDLASTPHPRYRRTNNDQSGFAWVWRRCKNTQELTQITLTASSMSRRRRRSSATPSGHSRTGGYGAVGPSTCGCHDDRCDTGDGTSPGGLAPGSRRTRPLHPSRARRRRSARPARKGARRRQRRLATRGRRPRTNGREAAPFAPCCHTIKTRVLALRSWPRRKVFWGRSPPKTKGARSLAPPSCISRARR
jgi:hypothetical protein